MTSAGIACFIGSLFKTVKFQRNDFGFSSLGKNFSKSLNECRCCRQMLERQCGFINLCNLKLSCRGTHETAMNIS